MDLLALRERINAQCEGFSTDIHWLWQQRTFTKVPSIREVCILGVYHGRDTAYAAALLQALRGDDFHITAVDLFSDAPCEDWPEEKRHLTWEEAGFGPAPTLERARQNLASLGLDQNVTFVKADAEHFLRETAESFDLIYIDTSHDLETTRRTIQAALQHLRPLGILAGDDFSDQGTWGVASAVREVCSNVRVFANTIWYAAHCEFTEEPV